MGMPKLFKQLKKSFDGSIMDDPEKWGFGAHRIDRSLELKPDYDGPFPINVDGSIINCIGSAKFRIIDQITLLAG